MDPTVRISTKPGKRMARLIFALALALGISAAACGGTSQSQGQNQDQDQERRYRLTGTVVSIDKEQQRLVVNHEEIPGFMGAMTMPYPIADPKDLERLSPGDQITADVAVTQNQEFVSKMLLW